MRDTLLFFFLLSFFLSSSVGWLAIQTERTTLNRARDMKWKFFFILRWNLLWKILSTQLSVSRSSDKLVEDILYFFGSQLLLLRICVKFQIKKRWDEQHLRERESHEERNKSRTDSTLTKKNKWIEKNKLRKINR